MFLVLAALMLQPASTPDLNDSYNRALAHWAGCTRFHLGVAAAASNRRDIGVVDEAMTRCTAEEAEVRALVREQAGDRAHDDVMREVVNRFRTAMRRHLRRQHRR